METKAPSSMASEISDNARWSLARRGLEHLRDVIDLDDRRGRLAALASAPRDCSDRTGDHASFTLLVPMYRPTRKLLLDLPQPNADLAKSVPGVAVTACDGYVS